MSLVIGIDYDSYKATLCTIHLDGPWRPRFTEARFRRDRESGEDAAFAALGQVQPRIVESLAVIGADATSVVWVERGYGNSRRSDWILGAFFGAIFSAICAPIVPIEAVNPLNLQEWKRTITDASGIGLTKDGRGNGQVKKPLANEATRAILAIEEIDGSAWSPDECDAFAIAYTGRVLNRAAVPA